MDELDERSSAGTTRRTLLATTSGGALAAAGCAGRDGSSPSDRQAATEEAGDTLRASTVAADTVRANRFTTVPGRTLADVQRAIDENVRVLLEPGAVYEGDTTITLSSGSGPEHQEGFIDARGATLNYTGDGKRAIEILPSAQLKGLGKDERGYENRAANGHHWLGGVVFGPGRDVSDSAAIYAEDMFGCVVRPTKVSAAEHGIWVRNRYHWSEANDLAITGRGSDSRSSEYPAGKDTGLGWAVRLDGGPAAEELEGTLSYRTSDVSIFWVGGDQGYLWLNGASMHGGTIQIRGFLADGATGLKITNGGWNRAAKAHLEWEGGGEDGRPVYIGPGNSPPLFISPRIGHPDRGHFADPERTIVNETSRPALCLKHEGLYNDYTEKLIGFSKDEAGEVVPSMREFVLDEMDLTQHSASRDGVVRRHDGSGDTPAGLYLWSGVNEVWRAVGREEYIQP
jgi:hypothetical protein